MKMGRPMYDLLIHKCMSCISCKNRKNVRAFVVGITKKGDILELEVETNDVNNKKVVVAVDEKTCNMSLYEKEAHSNYANDI